MIQIKLIILITIIFLTNNTALSKDLSITIDDFPLRCCVGDIEKLEKENDKFIEILSDNNAPIVAFVNEEHIANKNRTDKQKMIEMLNKYAEGNNEIGNHTYSHKIINKVGFEIFKKDILKGEKISKKLMEENNKTLRYLRHPGLGNGANKKQRQKLDEYLVSTGYIIAPVTIDTMDWKFNKYYLIAMQNKDTKLMKKIVEDYLNYIDKAIQFSEKASETMFKREIKHILLMHAIQINIDHLDDVIKRIKSHNYNFIALEEALKDEVYKIDATSDYGAGNWIWRWSKIFKMDDEIMQLDPFHGIGEIIAQYHQ